MNFPSVDHVVSVILNRLKYFSDRYTSTKWGTTMSGIVTQGNMDLAQEAGELSRCFGAIVPHIRMIVYHNDCQYTKCDSFLP